MNKIINGKEISEQIRDEIKGKVAAIKAGKKPCLAVVIVGEDPASKIYVRNKKRACDYVGFKSLQYELDKDTTEEELLKLIDNLNTNEEVNGILCQLPLPNHIDEDKIIKAIDPIKDVDCFHPYNVGLLSIGKPIFLPCTPAGIMELLERSEVEIEGKNCVVIGRSNIVGKPMFLMLLAKNATVTICHSRTKNLKEVCKRADILISAVGRAEMITAEYVKDGAVVIDVGMNRNAQDKLCGDVLFDDVYEVASKITPVPKGVGPMTISMLMVNNIKSFLCTK